MSEEWRNVVGFEDLYEVSNLGGVRSLAKLVKSRGGALRPIPKQAKKPSLTWGRPIVWLWKNNQSKPCSVAHLVLTAFVGPRPEGMECCHYPDRDPTNCTLSNLRWDTHKENCNDQISHGTRLIGSAHGGAKLNDAKVRKIRRLRKRGLYLREIANRMKVSISTINYVLKKRGWKHVK